MKYYKIGKVSQMTGLSRDTLRYYEKIGLIRHLEKDESGRKKYSEKDIEWIEFLKRLKTTKMSLKDIGKYADLRYEGDETSGERKKMLTKQLEKIMEEIEKLMETKQILIWKIKTYDEIEKKISRK
ncbi:MerR family transcriptional regulator [Sebaldella sp. S0638]|uniref:MerR family transcriptional regulator n=1 Tax=Sebaldella sp. S0638 TaxID=2957809 RepID=UPI0020A0B45A|nr:MerR family transcriptional regulator [Sebaldella sp. S0638]MCP1224670.1 MerR family transcriptional regulator [Sebaldella sp. S0638]